jgi:tetratricopeptide (TPR) repeat protein
VRSRTLPFELDAPTPEAVLVGDLGAEWTFERLYQQRQITNSPDGAHSVFNTGLATAQRPMAKARSELGGEADVSTFAPMGKMAQVLQTMEDLEEAEGLFRQTLQGLRASLGERHPETLALLNHMGVLLMVKGELADAETYLRKALEGKRRALGENHPSTLESLSALCEVVGSQGRVDHAVGLCLEALYGQRRVLSHDHPEILRSLSRLKETLARRYEIMGRPNPRADEYRQDQPALQSPHQNHPTLHLLHEGEDPVDDSADPRPVVGMDVVEIPGQGRLEGLGHRHPTGG